MNNQDGYYYLTANVETTGIWALPYGKTVALCLNGYRFTAKVNGPIISLSGQKFAPSDCVGTGTVTHDTGYSSCGVQATGTYNLTRAFHLFGSDNTGIDLRDGIALRMCGGKVTNNTDSGIKNDNSSTIGIYDGEISGNSAQNGGGIYATGGTLIPLQKDTKTAGNRTGTDGITDAQGGGMYLDFCKYNDKKSVKSEGFSQITGNKSGGTRQTDGTYIGGKDSNLSLPNNPNIQVYSGTKVGVTTSIKPAGTSLVEVAIGDSTEQITSDEGYQLYYRAHNNTTCPRTTDWVGEVEITHYPTLYIDLVYNGSEQTLVSSTGTVTHGEIQYRASKGDGTHYGDWNDELPKAKDAGTYYIQIRAVDGEVSSGKYLLSSHARDYRKACYPCRHHEGQNLWRHHRRHGERLYAYRSVSGRHSLTSTVALPRRISAPTRPST